MSRLIPATWLIPLKMPFQKWIPIKKILSLAGLPFTGSFCLFADKLYITWIHHEFEADTFFPEVKET